MNTPTSSRWPNSASYYGANEMIPTGAASPIAASSRSRSVSRTRATTPRSISGGNGAYYDSVDWEEMQEVEEELGTSSSSSDNFHHQYDPSQYQQQLYEAQLQQQQQQLMRQYSTSPSHQWNYQVQASSSSSQSQSSFASSDPFYLATAASLAANAASTAQPPTPSAPSSSNWFAPAVGFAAYAPTGNRWVPAPAAMSG